MSDHDACMPPCEVMAAILDEVEAIADPFAVSGDPHHAEYAFGIRMAVREVQRRHGLPMKRSRKPPPVMDNEECLE